MATMKFKGLDQYIEQLERLSDDAEDCIDHAIYDGAGVMADAVRREISGLPVGQKYAKPGERINTITSAQKTGLLNGLGVASLRKDGSLYNRKVGFDGYNGQKTKKYPGGQPNSLIARSVCAGTSFREPNDFMSRAIRSSRKPAEEAMKKKLESEIEKIMK